MQVHRSGLAAQARRGRLWQGLIVSVYPQRPLPFYTTPQSQHPNHADIQSLW